jgi:hypothetical protein
MSNSVYRRTVLNAAEMEEVMNDVELFDNVLLAHGYKPYMRDYELLVEVHIGPLRPGIYSYLFKYCVEAHIHTAVSDANYLASLDERLINHEAAKGMEGFVWGANWSRLYPGWSLKPLSDRAADWRRRLGLDFHEVEIKTEAYVISLDFLELTVSKVSDHISAEIEKWGYMRY